MQSNIAQWVEKGVISAEQGQQIADQTDKNCCGVAVPDCARLSLYGLSATAMIVAALLIGADHWRDVHSALKIAIALLGLAVAHGTGYWLRFQMQDPRRGDLCFLVATFFYGAAVFLVVDQYHMSDRDRQAFFAWGFFAWAAGTLPLAWVLNSRPMLVLTNLLATIWVVWHILATGHATYTSLFVAQGLCLIRWAYVNQSRALFIQSFLSLIVWWCMLAIAEDLGREKFFWIGALGPLILLIGLRHEETHAFASVYKFVGMALTVLSLLALSLPSVSADLTTVRHTPLVESAGEAVPLLEIANPLWFWQCGLAAFGAGIALVPASRRLEIRSEWPVLVALAAVTVLPAALSIVNNAYGHSLGGSTWATVSLAAVYNAGSIAVVVSAIIMGAARSSSWCVALGVAYFVAWVILVTIDLARNLTSAALILAVASAAFLLTVRFWFQSLLTRHETIVAKNT